MKAIKWAMVDGQVDVEIYETLDKAADMAEAASEYGSESLLYIEHDGNLYDAYWVSDRAEAKRESRPPAPPVPPVTHIVEVLSPKGTWAVYERTRSLDMAQREADDCIEAMGTDRVRIVDASNGTA